MGILGLFLGIAVLIFISYKGFHAVPTSLIAGAVVMIFNGINIWTGFTTSWIGGVTVVFTNYFILFLVSTLFANIMQMTGACETIAYKMVDWFGTKHILTVLAILCFLLCYGGVSFFVIMFVIGPLAFALFAELNIPRKMIIPAVAAGAAAFVLACPGSSQIQNVIPTALGTSLTAAPLLGIAMTGIGMVLSIIYVEMVYKKTMKEVEAGTIEGWVPNGTEMTVKRDKRPNAIGGFAPLFTVIGVIIIVSMISSLSATMLAVIAMCCGILVTFALNFKYLDLSKGKRLDMFKSWTSSSVNGAVASAITLGAVVGFGTLVSSTDAFATIVQALMNLNMSVYWKGVIATSAISGICGSASSGAQLTMTYLAEYFMNSGANLEVLHRLIANASITFDALPHATGCFLMLSYFGLNHKNSYKYIFVLNVVIPVIIVAVFTVICTMIY